MLKTEQTVDVFQIAKALRLQNPDFVTILVRHSYCVRIVGLTLNLETLSFQMEYEFCYNITMVFLESFEEYANFKLL